MIPVPLRVRDRAAATEFGTTRTVDVHLRHLREKIPMLVDAIMTIKNMGYKLRELP